MGGRLTQAGKSAQSQNTPLAKLEAEINVSNMIGTARSAESSQVCCIASEVRAVSSFAREQLNKGAVPHVQRRPDLHQSHGCFSLSNLSGTSTDVYLGHTDGTRRLAYARASAKHRATVFPKRSPTGSAPSHSDGGQHVDQCRLLSGRS
jgi:hypothetical protein